MHEITSENATEYLRARAGGRPEPPAAEPYEVRELAGGVSNVVLLVSQPGRAPFVLKQARGRLRVKDEWLCPVERIWREVDVLRICGEVLGVQNSEFRIQNEISALVPAILWEDRDNFLYAMTAAPAGHRTWKELLLGGDLERGESIAAACGEMLATLHAGTWQDARFAAQLDDRAYFDQLRVDPYYRQIARIHPDIAPQIDRLIDSFWQKRRCLVHGDFSPKNLLISAGAVTLIDFEVGHFGDPAFDLGFFQTHLVLKAIWAKTRRAEYLRLADGFWSAYRRTLGSSVAADELAQLEQRMLLNLAGCLLARVDGKSPVDYLEAEQRAFVRRLSREWIARPPSAWHAALTALQ